jgi:cell division septal protein FtsQ
MKLRLGEIAPESRRFTAWASIASIVLLIGAISAVVVAAHGWRHGVAVKDVRVSGTKLLTNGEILGLASVDKSKPLYSIDVDAVRRRIEANPGVRTADVSRDVLGTLSITVHERVPFACVMAGDLLAIDDSAFVLPATLAARTVDLPVITGIPASADIRTGKTTQAWQVKSALDMLRTARLVGGDLPHWISEVHIEDNGDLMCYTADTGIPVMIGQGGIGMKLLELDSFWKSYVAQRGSQNLEYVDLRFADQVVARWSQSQELAVNQGKARE